MSEDTNTNIVFNLNEQQPSIVSKFTHSEHFGDGMFACVCPSLRTKEALCLVGDIHNYRTKLSTLPFEEYLFVLSIIEKYCVDDVIIECTKIARQYYFDLYRPVELFPYLDDDDEINDQTTGTLFPGGIAGSKFITARGDRYDSDNVYCFKSYKYGEIIYENRSTKKSIVITLEQYDYVDWYDLQYYNDDHKRMRSCYNKNRVKYRFL